MKIEDFTGAVDIDSLQAEGDFEVLVDLFRAYDLKEIYRFLTALDRYLGLSRAQTALLTELIENMLDRGWVRDGDDEAI